MTTSDKQEFVCPRSCHGNECKLVCTGVEYAPDQCCFDGAATGDWYLVDGELE